ncbi:MAG: sugar porter family MFS transporter [Actinomyces ruminicola]|uniref:Sugar transporter n=2 Tax=Actinomyces ruminicola TaxID=332524 RepID=A0A1G9WY08_9ACTO|nr:sugar porter family MFS transporter [Actinomyces ruminicola]SDM89171.1 Sugar transporter [Actinomyces ruminicola]
MAAIGTIVGGSLSDRFGRHPILMLIGLLYIAGALGTALASLEPVFLVFRFIVPRPPAGYSDTAVTRMRRRSRAGCAQAPRVAVACDTPGFMALPV